MPNKTLSFAIIGNNGVGKTSIIRLLFPEIKSHRTIYEMHVGDMSYIFWELRTSSKEPSRLAVFSQSFITQSEPYKRYLLLVTDSSMDDVNQLVYSVPFLRNLFPDTRFAVIANKQDTRNALAVKRIEHRIRLPTLGLVAQDPSYRIRLCNLLSYLLEFDPGL